ncbi:C10 family peptidase [Flavobacterium sp. MDT1-60]|uniref:C10 family peptidase n=1 Tax=Flavobacterium sp. MDT1-60 TaxID=1979344 RepID=UPI00177CA5BA|nr:C10 family peptidase [Flavobacterium sp. MDT1-60]QOG01919.1 C10 family peptidase [Flavobacterium sp. MDT1-60]
MKQPIRKKLTTSLFFLLLVTIFSCSKDNESENLKDVQQENFVDSTLAKEIASEILFKTETNSSVSKSTSTNITKKNIESITEVKNDQGNTVFYIINYKAKGYILLSADNREQPIVAFSEDSKFVLDADANDFGLKTWFNNTKKQITSIQNSSAKQTEEKKIQWRQVKNMLANNNIFSKIPADQCFEHTTSVSKGPFLQSSWQQAKGFNSALKYISCDGDDFQVYAGCVPISMAQVMRYYQYPTNYNWSAMPMEDASSTTANFIADIHTAIGSIFEGQLYYNCHATGVIKSADMGKVLKSKFNYTSADTAPYNYSTVKANLEAGKPVLLVGAGNAGAHMWVCDGYSASSFYSADCTGSSTLYFHMNWGWKNGENNGFYAYNNFNPSIYTFNEALVMTYNIKP